MDKEKDTYSGLNFEKQFGKGVDLGMQKQRDWLRRNSKTHIFNILH